MRSEGYGSRRVCLSVKSNLTSVGAVRPENAVTYLVGDEGRNVCVELSETALLQRSSTPSVVQPYVRMVGHFGAHAYYGIYHVHGRPFLPCVALERCF